MQQKSAETFDFLHACIPNSQNHILGKVASQCSEMHNPQ